MAIKANDVVALTYRLHTVENGEKVFVEETTAEQPLDFLYGVGMMLPKFEENIADLNVGDKISFELAPDDAYGQKDDKAFAQLPVDMFKEPRDNRPFFFCVLTFVGCTESGVCDEPRF